MGKTDKEVLIWYQEGDEMIGAFGTLVKVKGKTMGKIGNKYVKPEIIVDEKEEKDG